MKKHFAKLLFAALSMAFIVSLSTNDVSAAGKKNVTILIDPGHGGYDSGAEVHHEGAGGGSSGGV